MSGTGFHLKFHSLMENDALLAEVRFCPGQSADSCGDDLEGLGRALLIRDWAIPAVCVRPS